MRWICKKLRELAIEYFPDADKYQIGSLVGGYIYLRFFNPAIVTPDAINFIRNKPTKKMRRNLILVDSTLCFRASMLIQSPLVADCQAAAEPLERHDVRREGAVYDPVQ